MARPTFSRINLDAIMSNVRNVKKYIGQRKLCAAVKADGYGHGAAAVAKAMSNAGADSFGVAMTEEGIKLREAGITKPVILLTRVPEEDIETLIDYELTACITDEPFALELSKVAAEYGRPVPAQVNVDTGMHRIGVPHQEAADLICRINQLPAIEITGIFTHFACAENRGTSREQLSLFGRVISDLNKKNLHIPLLHVTNSAGTLLMPEAHMGGVRPGLILYGLCPPSITDPPIELKPAMSLHTRVSFCKEVKPGTPLGYGHTYTTRRTSIIATLPIGYDDGYLRQYSNNGCVLIKGHRAPVVGRVCMDQTLVDVTDIPGVQRGDEVVIYGEQEGQIIRIEEMASRLDRIPYELTCAVGSRVRRQYVLNNVIVGETPMGSLVPPDVLHKIFPDSNPDLRTTRRPPKAGAA